MAQHAHSAADHPGHQDSGLEDTHATHHIVSPMVYLVVVIILFILTWVTIVCAYKDFGGLWNRCLHLELRP
jgi:hypothetical protein